MKPIESEADLLYAWWKARRSQLGSKKAAAEHGMTTPKNFLVHEIWLDPNADGQMLPGLCLAGPMGDDFRKLLNPGAVMFDTIDGISHFDVMTKYWEMNGWGIYHTDFSQDHEPYPADWISIQRTFFNSEK